MTIKSSFSTVRWYSASVGRRRHLAIHSQFCEAVTVGKEVAKVGIKRLGWETSHDCTASQVPFLSSYISGSSTIATTYTHILDLAKEAEPPADGILSRTIFQDDQNKAVVFGFGQGQELSEHTAAKPAMLLFVKGEATVGLGDDIQEAQAGTWVHMPANLKHSIKAKTPMVMLLVLLK